MSRQPCALNQQSRKVFGASMKVRIGIDVGGTFTDAVAIDDQTYEIRGTVKIPTTHTAKGGVAEGIIQALHRVMSENDIHPEDVVFIAHGTTQSTNALLEGDVADVGVLTLGSGLQGLKSKGDTAIPPIELAKNKFLHSRNAYIDDSRPDWENRAAEAVDAFSREGIGSFVAAEAFSVDDPANENRAVELCAQKQVPATATNDVSKLYGLKIRTRTAVINASIMPRMLETALMTEQSIRDARIESQLMIMRCDGGVMTMNEVRKRPILTILSGPAAGVAGALMYEKLTDGFFFEVGGTSTDISCVRDGKVMIRYAEVGGHKTYLNSLDIHTVGIGGGSMIAVDANGRMTDVGPRSAHIANLDYEAYASADDIAGPSLSVVRPKPTDSPYACIECGNGKKFALTLSGAAIIAGYVGAREYAYADSAASRKAWAPLAEKMGCTVEEAARKALGFAAAKVMAAVREIAASYRLNLGQSAFVGGGGGGAVVVPFIAEQTGVPFKIAQNAQIISTIGVALAMIRETVERTVPDPTEQDIASIRHEAAAKVLENGAEASSVEVTIEIDPQKNLLRAVAVGATEIRSKTLGEKLDENQQKKIVAENLDVDESLVYTVADNGVMKAMSCRLEKKRFSGLFKKVTNALRIIDDEGVIRLKKNNAQVRLAPIGDVEATVLRYLETMTRYDDGGDSIPGIYLVAGRKVLDFTGVLERRQLLSLIGIECRDYPAEEKVIVVSVFRDQL